MKVVFAPGSFKGSVRSHVAAQAMAEGWALERPADVALLRPMADGGAGTLDVLASAVPEARWMPVEVEGPVGDPVDAGWVLLPPTPDAPSGTGVVELATACGLALLGEERAPWDAHTTGLGQMIRAAVEHGVSRLFVGVGASASTDGGVGCLRALGYVFSDANGDPIAPGARGLGEVAQVDRSGALALPEGGVIVLSDVTNPLTGAFGAAAAFGRKKGFADDELVDADAALVRLAEVMGGDPLVPGAGAAGGTGFALMDWGATPRPGAAEVARLIGLGEAVVVSGVVVTGEGQFDHQSRNGKAPGLVMDLAAHLRLPVGLIAGCVAPAANLDGIRAVQSLADLAGSVAAARRDTEAWLRIAGRSLARDFNTWLSRT